MKRGPKLGGFNRSKVKPSRQHARDRIRFIVQRHNLADYIFLCAVTVLTCFVSQQERPRCSRQVFAVIEIAAEYRRDAKRSKKTVAYSSAPNDLRASRSSQDMSGALIYVQRAEHVVEPLPIEVIQIRKIASRENGYGLVDADQPARALIWQRLDERRIYKSQYRHGTGQTKSQHHDRGEGEPGIFAQLSNRKRYILEQALDCRQRGGVAIGLLGRFQTSKAYQRVTSCQFRRHARA